MAPPMSAMEVEFMVFLSDCTITGARSGFRGGKVEVSQFERALELARNGFRNPALH